MNIYNKIDSSNSVKPDKTSPPPYLDVGNYGYTIPAPSSRLALINSFKSWVYVFANRNALSMAQPLLSVYAAKSNTNETPYESKVVNKDTFDHLKSISSVKSFVKKSLEIEELFDHPLEKLLKKGNAFMDGFEIRYLTAIYLELTGDGFWYIPKNSFGVPYEIWPLNSGLVEVVPSKYGHIAGYVYHIGGEKIPFDPDEIIHFKYPNPSNMYYGLSPLEANWNSFKIDESIENFQSAIFKNMGRPDGILAFEQNIDDDEYKRIRDQWQASYGGSSKAGKIAILEGGAKYNSIASTPRELEYLQGEKSIKEQLANAYGQNLAMYSEAANRSNVDSAIYSYMFLTIMPKLTFMVEKINKTLAPMYDEKLFVAFEDIVPENKEYELKRMDLYLKNGVKVVNEVRKSEGLPEAVWGEYPMTNMAQVPYAYDTFSDKMLRDEIRFDNSAAGTPTSQEDNENSDSDNKPREDESDNEENKKVTKSITKSLYTEDEIESIWESFADDANEYEDIFKSDLKSLFKIYKKDLKQRISNNEDYIDWIPKNEDYQEPIKIILAKHTSKMYKKSYKSGLRELKRIVRGIEKQVDVEGSFDVKDEDAIEAIKERLNDSSLEILNTYRKQVLTAILNGLEKGLETPDIIEAVLSSVDNLSEYEAGLIARTEMIWAGNAGRLQSFKESGFVETKIWWTAGDERVCNYCGALHETEIPLDDSFDLEMLNSLGLNTKFHNGFLSFPPVHPRCRCLIIAGRIKV